MKQDQSNNSFLFKVVFVELDTPSVFKHHLKDFDEDSSSFWSVGFEPTIKQFYSSDKEIRLQIWNLRLSPRYSEVRKMYMQGSLGLVIFFHQSHTESFTQVSSFFHDFKTSISSTFHNFSSNQLLLVNLLSSEEGVELVSTNKAQVLASSLGMSYYEMYPEDNKRFHEILSTLARAIVLSREIAFDNDSH